MVSSPCVGVCETEDGICVACKRTVEDIAEWPSMSERERIERMQELERETDVGDRSPNGRRPD
ncbi:DUF1289 domain-containing protein [Haloplanus litoreus]|uniref:DUF1289 domain-containing protein n=1 Tax=Haloplanus litoreus TaxID=767515 RepID=A0ABD5ZWY8_9EURY